MTDIQSKLSAHFDPVDIEWRIQQCGWKDENPWAMVLAYITSRAIMDRLDDVCGPFGWQNQFIKHDGGATLCGISIKEGDHWVTKWDGAQETDIEGVKGGLSGAMKRAGVQWGIGRYLYHLDTTFAETRLDYPPRQEKPIWHKHYDKAEKKAFFWKNPDLPKWALPGVQEGIARVARDGSVHGDKTVKF